MKARKSVQQREKKAKLTAGMFSSSSDEWGTPQWLFDILDAEFHFTLDVCATMENRKCERYFDIKRDGLKQSWKNEVCWMNPPYSDIKRWVEKAHTETQEGMTKVVALIPSRTDTRYFHKYVLDNAEQAMARENGVEIRYLKGRLRFTKPDGTVGQSGSPFPSMIVVWKPWRPRRK